MLWLQGLLLMLGTQEPVKPSVLVMPLRSTDFPAALVTVTEASLLLTFHESQAFSRISTSKDIEASLSVEAAKQMTNCTEVSCLVEIMGNLGTDFVALAEVSVIKDVGLFNVRLVKKGAVAGVGESQVCMTETQKVGVAARWAAQQALHSAGLTEKPTGEAPGPCHPTAAVTAPKVSTVRRVAPGWFGLAAVAALVAPVAVFPATLAFVTTYFVASLGLQIFLTENRISISQYMRRPVAMDLAGGTAGSLAALLCLGPMVALMAASVALVARGIRGDEHIALEDP